MPKRLTSFCACLVLLLCACTQQSLPEPASSGQVEVSSEFVSSVASVSSTPMSVSSEEPVIDQKLNYQPAYFKTLFTRDVYLNKEGKLIQKPKEIWELEYGVDSMPKNFFEPDDRPMDSILPLAVTNSLLLYNRSELGLAGIPTAGSLFIHENTTAVKYKNPQEFSGPDPLYHDVYMAYLPNSINIMKKWKNLKQVELFTDGEYVALTKDNSLLLSFSYSDCNTTEWKDLYRRIENWLNIKAISTNIAQIAAITNDGHVLYDSSSEKIDTSAMHDIIQVDFYTYDGVQDGIYGLKSDGTLMTAGRTREVMVDRNIRTLVREPSTRHRGENSKALTADGYIREIFKNPYEEQPFKPIGPVPNVKDVVQVQYGSSLGKGYYYVLYKNGTIKVFGDELQPSEEWLQSLTDVKTS